MLFWELFKLSRQRRTYLGLGAAALVPIIFVAAIEITHRGPEAGDAPFAAQLFSNGLVIPLITLAFGSFVMLPAIVVLVAGDTVAGEASAGTLKTILSRSIGRTRFFLVKVAAVALYTLAVLVVFAGVGLLAGWLVVGLKPLAGPDGTPIPVGEGIALIWACAGVLALPLLALAAVVVFLSAATHNSTASVVGGIVFVLLLRLVSGLGLTGFLDPYLITNQFDAWLNLLRQPVDWPPVVRAIWVSVLWMVGFFLGAWGIFVRRDILG